MDTNKEERKVFDGGVSDADVEKWKGQHRKVFRIDVADGDELHVGYFHRPSLQLMAAASKVAKSDEVRSGETLFDGCFLGGSEVMRQDSVLFLSAMQELNKAIGAKASSLKNL